MKKYKSCAPLSFIANQTSYGAKKLILKEYLKNTNKKQLTLSTAYKYISAPICTRKNKGENKLIYPSSSLTANCSYSLS